jgi:hypothetical protein
MGSKSSPYEPYFAGIMSLFGYGNTVMRRITRSLHAMMTQAKKHAAGQRPAASNVRAK